MDRLMKMSSGRLEPGTELPIENSLKKEGAGCGSFV
jgi:hypothetical protein